MAKPEWGIKRICISCGAKYYDMQKPTPACPACGAEHNPELVLRSRRQRGPEDDSDTDNDAPLATTINENADIELEEAASGSDDDDDAVLADDLDDDVDGGEFIENSADLDDDENN